MFEAVETQLIISLLNRLGASTANDPKDAWCAYLQSKTGITDDLNAQEKIFVRSKGGSGETLHDIWDSYLNSKNYTGTYVDKLHSFCNTASSF